jgi:3-hydroxybutyryl-CoA dehydratase
MSELYKSHFFEDLAVGMRETMTKTITSEDVACFANLSGDHNPLHVDKEFAKTTIFGECIAHGFYTGSFISALIGTYLPGSGAIYLNQTLSFKAPVRIGATVVASVEIVELIERGHRCKLHCEVKVGDVVAVEGEALVKAPSRGTAASKPKDVGQA